MAGLGKGAGGDFFDHPAGVHHQNSVAKGRDQTQVVRDEDQAHAALAHQPIQNGQHLQLHRDIQRRGGLIGNQQLGVGDQHHGDHGALAHAARHLMRVEPVDPYRIVNLHRLKRSQSAPARLGTADPAVGTQCLDNLLADGHDRVERKLGILQHHGNTTATQRAPLLRRAMHQICALKSQALGRHPPFRRSQTKDGPPGLRLARTRLAHNAQALAPQLETNAAHRFGKAAVPVGKGHAKIIDHQHWLGAACRRSALVATHLAALGSSASRRPSPNKLKARLTRKMAAPGAAATHHWSST